METLHGTEWDVVICGTGISQSVLALALSRSGKRILHVDRNGYYGGNEAAFSLDEASAWLDMQQNVPGPSGRLQPISITKEPSSERLAPSRSYNLTLSPHILYSRSTLLEKLVSSGLHTQLEFQAVGAWWMLESRPWLAQSRSLDQEPFSSDNDSHNVHQKAKSSLRKIPSTREDVFSDDTLPTRDKRALMKFLRWLLGATKSDQPCAEDVMLSRTLTESFGLPPWLHPPLTALSLSYHDATTSSSQATTLRIKQHLTSIGTFGTGFAAILPKFGGLAEVCQVACRASAVGGATYVLNREVESIVHSTNLSTKSSTLDDTPLELCLSRGDRVKSRFVIGCEEDLPKEVTDQITDGTSVAINILHSISIVSATLSHLFAPVSEHGPIPAGVVVADFEIDPHSTSQLGGAEKRPTYLIVHSSDSGDCPPGQCVIYASTSISAQEDEAQAQQRLRDAVLRLISTNMRTSNSDLSEPRVLWSMTYLSRGPSALRNRSSNDMIAPSDTTPVVPQIHSAFSGRVLVFPPHPEDLVFHDSMLDHVRETWKRIMGTERNGAGVEHMDFLNFAQRHEYDGGEEDKDDDDDERQRAAMEEPW